MIISQYSSGIPAEKSEKKGKVFVAALGGKGVPKLYKALAGKVYLVCFLTFKSYGVNKEVNGISKTRMLNFLETKIVWNVTPSHEQHLTKLVQKC